MARAGACTTGLLYDGVDDDMLALLDHFEGDLYERRTVTVGVGDRELDAQAYVVPDERSGVLSGEAWSRELFAARHAPAYVEHCTRLRNRWGSDPAPAGEEG